MDASTERYRGLVRSLIEGRKLIVLGGAVAGSSARMLPALRGLGAEKPLLLAQLVGTGTVPRPDEADWVSLDVRAPNQVEAIHEFERTLRDLPAAVVERLDHYDPRREALAFGMIVLSSVPEVAGRRRYGARPGSWAALEDKTVIDALWERLGVAHAPSAVVPARLDALLAAARELDRGDGTVWSGDCRRWIHGGGLFVRRVRTREDAEEVARLFGASCDRARVMPFLEGIPCSVHGLVLPDGTAVLRPVEMITLRRPGAAAFLYGGCATHWDPPAEDREAMRAVARTVGEGLRAEVDYRGPFTIDGVLTAEGFRPTELNPRWGAGLNLIGMAVPDLPLGLLALAAIEREPWDFRAAELEALLLAGADANRHGWGRASVGVRWEESGALPLVLDGDRYRRAREDEPPHAQLAYGPDSAAGFVRFAPEPGHLPVGEPFAPHVVRALAAADRELGTSIGPLEAARQ